MEESLDIIEKQSNESSTVESDHSLRLTSTSVNSISTTRSELEEWRNKVCEIQKSRMTPEALESLKFKAERIKKASKAHRSATMMERCNNISNRTQHESMKKTYISPILNSARSAAPNLQSSTLQRPPFGFGFGFGGALSAPSGTSSLPPAPSKDILSRFEYNDIASKNRMQSTIIQSAAFFSRSKAATLSSEPFGSATSNDDEEEDKEFQAFSKQLDDIEKEVESDSAAFDALAQQTPGIAPINANDFDTLLQTLTREPTEDAELATKFALFEDFLATVSTIRDQTIQFWLDSRDQFEGGALAAGDKAIKDIDSEESMGIVEDPRYWFVYQMMKTAKRNSLRISRTLSEIRSRLQLLTMEDIECPFCLESVNKAGATTLPCCHRCCTDCWQNWQRIKGVRAFCPLCRHDAFVEEILTPETGI